jgi:hypothetical protein
MFHLEHFAEGDQLDIIVTMRRVERHPGWAVVKFALNQPLSQYPKCQELPMKNSFLNFRCRKCGPALTSWAKMPPTEMHAYRDVRQLRYLCGLGYCSAVRSASMGEEGARNSRSYD